MSALVINLTRFGDILQTQPVVAGLAAFGEAPAMVCLENFAQTAGLLRHMGQVVALPGSGLLARTNGQWPAAVGQLLEFARQLPRATRVINLTPSLPSRLLARLAHGRELTGFGLDDFGFNRNSGPWALFLQAASQHRGASPFNLVDVFCRVADLPPAGGRLGLRRPADTDLAAMRRLLLAEAPAGSTDFLGLQLGASEARRRWPVEHFARLAGDIHRRFGLVPVLLGSKGEAELAQAYLADADHPVVNLVGRTDLPGLAAAVASLRLLVSNDTGTMHLAAGLGVPVAAIFLATAQPWDTGPYLPGALCLEPDLPCHPCDFNRPCGMANACQRAIEPAVLAGLVGHWLENGAWPRAVEGARAWQARVDEAGYLELEALGRAEGQDRTRWLRLQRRVYRDFLDGEAAPGLLDMPLPGTDFRHGLRPALDEACGLAAVLSSQGRLLAVAPREALKAKFLAGWQRLTGALAGNPRLGMFGTMLHADVQERGEDLAGILACLERHFHVLEDLRRTLAGMEVD